MTEDNVMEFCQWLIAEKGIEAGNLSDYINNNEEEVLKLAKEYKKPKFKIGGKINLAVDKFKYGGKTKKVEKKQIGGPSKPNHTIYDLRTGKVSKETNGIGNMETYIDNAGSKSLRVIDGDSTIVSRKPNWPDSRTRSYEDISTGARVRNTGFAVDLRSLDAMKEMFNKKYPNVRSMEAGGQTNDRKYVMLGNMNDSTERFTRKNGDEVELRTMPSSFPGSKGRDSVLMIKPLMGEPMVFHNMPNGDWSATLLESFKSIDPNLRKKPLIELEKIKKNQQ